MKINFTKNYRLWFLLTSTGVLGALITYFMGYSSVKHEWIMPYYNIHTVFIFILLAAVIMRLYMAINKINPVPLMHLIHAKSFLSVIIALAYISMCSVLLITLGSELYLFIAPTEEHALWVYSFRDFFQPVFAIMVAIHVVFVLYINIAKQRGSLRKLMLAIDN